MNAVGIDVSKGKSMIVVMRPFGKMVISPLNGVANAATTSVKKSAGNPSDITGTRFCGAKEQHDQTFGKAGGRLAAYYIFCKSCAQK